jgi:hypothetical protein
MEPDPMPIPDRWLNEEESLDEVVDGLSMDRDLPDLWLDEWFRFVGHFGPDDEIWSYIEPSPDDLEEGDWMFSRWGYARVRHGEVVESIPGHDYHAWWSRPSALD